MGRLLAALVALLLVAPTSQALAAGAELDAVEHDLIDRINVARAGQDPVQGHPQLAAAAHAQAAWLAELSGERRAGLTAESAHCGGPGCPEVRVAQAGWSDALTAMGEVIRLGGRFAGQSSEAGNDDAIAAWELSAGHREQLHAPGWNLAGVGIVQDITVVLFARACTGGCPPGMGTGRSVNLGDATPLARARAGAEGGCAPAGRVRLVRRGARGVGVEVRLSCRRAGRHYRVRLRDGRRHRVVRLRRHRTVVAVAASRRGRWVRVSVDENARRLSSVRMRVGQPDP